MNDNINEFLWQSNLIENEKREQAFKDAKIAWSYAYKYRNRIRLFNVLRIHELLLKNIDKKIAGTIRTKDVWIGGKCKYFISESLLREELVSWLNMYDRLKKGNEKEAHIIFENIHPFFDGNGRVGRILYNIHRVNQGKKIHVIHVGKEQMDYYNWFIK